MNDSHGGDPARHLPLESVNAGLDARTPPPRDAGTVVALVTRQAGEARTAHEELRFGQEWGALGDRWSPVKHGMANQVTAMESGVGELIANGQPLDLFGDNLIVDLALDVGNLPPGSRLRLGKEVVLQVTDKPHTGCSKYRARFGADALTAISREDRRELRLRGIHLEVVRSGTVAVGDPIVVVSRG